MAHVATRLASATASHPGMAALPSRNATVPVGAPALPETVAVNDTD